MVAEIATHGAHLDEMHAGDIQGALGTIRSEDLAARRTWWARLRTFLAVLGPGLIVMVGDNDAGAFSTYTQAAQNYGTTLLWTLLLLVPVLYVNQEMVLRLGAVTGIGHARLILERFGKFWGAFSVVDLFILNALTLVTEFIGVSLALGYFGIPKIAGVAIALWPARLPEAFAASSDLLSPFALEAFFCCQSSSWCMRRSRNPRMTSLCRVCLKAPISAWLCCSSSESSVRLLRRGSCFSNRAM